MRRTLATVVVALVVAALVPQAHAQDPSVTHGSVYARIADDEIALGNTLVERRWQRDGFQTLSMTDKRGGSVAAAAGPDFRLTVGNSPADLTSDLFDVASAEATEIPGGLRLTMELTGPGLNVTRVIEAYEGIAGFKTQTILEPLRPLVLRGYTLDEAAVGDQVTATIHAFRAGADWREPNWGGPDLAIGDPHAGTWRESHSGDEPGEDVSGAAQWISTRNDESGHSMFMVMERNDWPSSRAAYTRGSERLVVDYSADIVIAGPFEENVHAENPNAGETPGRHRVIAPLEPFALESAFTGFGATPDDEPWQFYKYLSQQRLDAYDNEVTFNSNGTDANVRSDGAKDDMVEEVVEATAPIARQLGVETFILDDGWQARSGDWEPDCGDTPGSPNTDPRWDGTEATAKFRPRFSDCNFEKVRELIAPMELGLWMNAMHFHPRAHTYMSHPEWACKVSGDATGATSLVTPSGGSNDAGIGTWSAMPQIVDHIEARIQNAITNWGVTYFKFDFLVWLDCAGQNDLYQYKEAFTAMLDRLIGENPEVTFEIDETNDYRLFPFDSVSRGPSWFQNGSPEPDRLLHNIWNLSPFIPAYSLGQHFLGGNQYTRYPVDTLMSIALPSHMTFFSELRNLPASVIEQARPWIDFYKANREQFAQMTYPLLADPLELDWTALQTWNPEEGRGALLAFRQQSDDQTKSIALRNVPPGMSFDLFEGPSGRRVATVTSQQLTTGIDVTIPSKDGARVLLIKPAETPEFDPATSLVYDGATTVRAGRILTFEATLLGSQGPIAGMPIAFVFRGSTYQVVTDSTGRATAQIKALGPPGTYEVRSRFDGSDRHLPSEDRDPIRITSNG